MEIVSFDKIKDLNRKDQENIIEKYIISKRSFLDSKQAIESVKSLPDNIWINLLKSFLHHNDIESTYTNVACNSCSKYVWSGYIRHGYIKYFDHISKDNHNIYCYDCKDKCGCNSDFFKSFCNNCQKVYCDKHSIYKVYEDYCDKCKYDPLFITILKETLIKNHIKKLNSNKKIKWKYKHSLNHKIVSKFLNIIK